MVMMGCQGDRKPRTLTLICVMNIERLLLAARDIQYCKSGVGLIVDKPFLQAAELCERFQKLP